MDISSKCYLNHLKKLRLSELLYNQKMWVVINVKMITVVSKEKCMPAVWILWQSEKRRLCKKKKLI